MKLDNNLRIATSFITLSLALIMMVEAFRLNLSNTCRIGIYEGN